MTVWSVLSTIFVRQHILQKICLVLFGVVISTMLIGSSISSAAPNTSKVVNFQGRLQTAAGAVVPDGYYNMQFKIYQGGSGSAVGNPGGTLNWTENYLNNGGTGGVKVKNGLFSISLGSKNPFGSSVDWSQDNLWLSMNIAGSAQACSQFDSGSCLADGEMLPMKPVSAVPYAISAGSVGGKTAEELVQIGQGTQTDASDKASIAINKTGPGNVIQLQSSGSDIFTISGAGNITLGNATDKSITMGTSASGAGNSLTLGAGAAASGSGAAGGDIVLQGGAGDGAGDGGSVIAKATTSSEANAFQVQNAAGETVLNINAADRELTLGGLTIASPAENSMGQPVSLWSNNTTPPGTPIDDGTALNLGVVFKSSTPGYVTGLKFYRPANGNRTGGDVGKLWECNNANCSLAGGGTQLASVSFPIDTTAGWKTATFSSPVLIEPGTNYVMTYFNENGVYYGTNYYFGQGLNSLYLSSPASTETPNGRFYIGPANFPNNNYKDSNYWVDPIFRPAVKIDSIHSTGDLTLGASGNTTIGSVASDLKLQGSKIDITGNDISIGSSTGTTTVNSSLKTQSITSKTDTNSTSAFSVQNAASASQLAVDTLNSRVTIGTSDTTGTLLVLDTKTTAGDPTGTNGAMYYNSDASKFRCYQAGEWQDCITPLPVYKTTTSNQSFTDTAVNVTNMSFPLAANTKYQYKFVIQHDGTNGAGFGVTSPSGSTGTNWCINATVRSPLPATGQSNTAYCGTGDVSTVISNTSLQGDKFVSVMEGYVETAGTTGNLQLRAKSTTGGGTISTGTFGVVQIVR